MSIEEKIRKTEAAFHSVAFSPVSCLVMAVGSCLAGNQFYSFLTTGDKKQLALGIIATAYAAIGGVLNIYHRQKRERLAKKLKENGYKEEMIRPYLYSWCGRRIAKAACFDAGCSRKLEKTIEEYGFKGTDLFPLTEEEILALENNRKSNL